MSTKLTDLIATSKKRVQENNLKEGRRLGRQALVGADVAREEFLKKGSASFQTDESKELADWFGDLAFVFNASKDDYEAAKCFYTATVFDRDWSPEEHARVAGVLLGALVFDQPEAVVRSSYQGDDRQSGKQVASQARLDRTCLQKHEKLLKFLQELDKLACDAERLQRWLLCILITSDVQRVHVYLHTEYQLGPDEFKKLPTSCQGIRRSARCGLQLRDHGTVRRFCQIILTEFTDNDDPEAFGLWARSLYATKEFEMAAEKCRLAVLHSKNKERQGYERQLAMIKERLGESRVDTLQDLGHRISQLDMKGSQPTPPVRQRTVNPAGDNDRQRTLNQAGDDTRHRTVTQARDNDRQRTVTHDGNKTRQGPVTQAGDNARQRTLTPVGDKTRERTVTPVGDKTRQRTVTPAGDNQAGDNASSHNTAHSPLQENGMEVLYRRTQDLPDDSIDDDYDDEVDRHNGDIAMGESFDTFDDGLEAIDGRDADSADVQLSNDEVEEVDAASEGSDEAGPSQLADGAEAASIYYRSLSAGDNTEASFYEQSCRQYYTEDESDRPETSQMGLLHTGLQLSESYMFQFEDRHPSVQKRDPFYPEMLNNVALKERLLKQPDKFKRGILQIESSHMSKCLPIESTDSASAIEISGRSKANQAFCEDEVVVELLDKESDRHEQRFGQVLGVLKRNRHQNVDHPVFICTLDDMESHLVRPMCKTVPKIHILNKQILEKYKNEKRYKIEFYKYHEQSGTLQTERNSIKDINPGDREKYVFLVVFIKWSRWHVYPIGAIIDILPSGNSIENGLTILNLQHQIPALYSKHTVQRLESVRKRQKDEPGAADLQGRTDLTNLNTFTIDPPGSTDIDDALSVEPYHEDYKVGVHIADVSSYVKKDDQVDEEARERSTTFYSGIRRPRHMLPEPLSTNLCSLLPHKLRLTISVFFYLNSKGKPIQMEGNNFEIKLSYIKSRHQLTYSEAQRMINGERDDHPSCADIKRLYQLAKAVRRQRLGAAMFAVDLEEDEALEDDLALEAHYLVEEFMIMANKKVAQVLTLKFPHCVPLRCQKPPQKEDLENFVKKQGVFVNALMCLQDRKIGGYLTPELDSLIQAQSTDEMIVGRTTWGCISRGEGAAGRFLLTDAIHPLQYLSHSHWLSIQEHALYRCSGSLKDRTQDGQHFSLEVYPYTHFTSPIRRYCDLLVHRLLKALLRSQACPYQRQEVENICAHINSRMARAKDYQKGCRLLQQAVELKQHQRMVSCFIDDVSERGTSCRTPALPNISQREISFSLLGVGFKPVLMENESGYDTVKTTWMMRLYNFYKTATNNPDGGKTWTVNPYQEMRFMPLSKWGRILKSYIGGHMNDFQRYLRNTEVECKMVGQLDVTTECNDVSMIQPNTKFSMTFTHGQIVKLQMTSVPRRGTLVPCPMLYDMTENVKICLLHRDMPVLYLSRYTTNPTLDHYKSIKFYLERWLPLIDMEAAIGAVSNEESCVLNDVPIKFKSANTGKFLLPEAECMVRNIEFSGTINEAAEGETFKDPGSSYDWLCLRCRLNADTSRDGTKVKAVLEHSSMWMGHAVVTEVKKRNQEIVVVFQLHERSPPLPLQARCNIRFQVEILRKSEVDRRTESFIKRLPGMPDTLAESIALKDKKCPIPSLDQRRIDMAFSKHLVRDLHIPPGENVKYPLPRNNRKQQEAVDKALASRFSLIQGPPGTGKTYVGIKLICLFEKINRQMASRGQDRKQVLFCGPSNKSVDLVARWMKDRLGPNLRPKFIRVYGRSIEAIDFPIPGRTFLSKKSTRNQKSDDDLKDYALHHLIRKEGPDGNRYAADINELDELFRRTNYEQQEPGVVSRYVHMVREASIDEIRKYDVILCTTAVGSNPKVLEACSVYQVIVDEAGMCPEPQCLVPIIATKADQVVLIGDHKQLRPIIMCKEAAELGLDRSLFERYVSRENDMFTMLVQQYRMNPDLCKFPSVQFYEKRLKTERGRWFDPNSSRQYIWQTDESFPHVLVHVEGEEKGLTVSTEEGNEQSKSNLEEVQQVVRVFRYLINENISDAQINIMSQYNAQCSEIKKALEEETLTNYQVSTVVSSQGGEWDYVIFSTVRSMPDYKIEKNPTLGWCKQNLGFITDQNQINVALTRARKGLIIIGNRRLLECDEVWKKLVHHYDDRDCIKTPDQFPPQERSRRERMRDNIKQSNRKFGDEMFVRGQATSYSGPIDVEAPKRIGKQFKHRNQRGPYRKK